jgi:hypothetical protein
MKHKMLIVKPVQELSLKELLTELKRRCAALWCSYVTVDEHNTARDGLAYKGATPLLRAVHNTAEEKLNEMLTLDRKAFAKDYEAAMHQDADGEITVS